MPFFLLFLLFGGIFFYRLGDIEYDRGFAVAGLSWAIGLITFLGLNWSWPGYLLGQGVLLAGLTWYNLRRQKRRGW